MLVHADREMGGTEMRDVRWNIDKGTKISKTKR
jgi:hypothetical protein